MKFVGGNFKRVGTQATSWIRAGALGLGFSAALASGSGLAHADSTPGGGSPSNHADGASASKASRGTSSDKAAAAKAGGTPAGGRTRPSPRIPGPQTGTSGGARNGSEGGRDVDTPPTGSDNRDSSNPTAPSPAGALSRGGAETAAVNQDVDLPAAVDSAPQTADSAEGTSTNDMAAGVSPSDESGASTVSAPVSSTLTTPRHTVGPVQAVLSALGILPSGPSTPADNPIVGLLWGMFRRTETPAATAAAVKSGAVTAAAVTEGNSATYSVTDDWGTGHTAAISVTAGSSSMNGWTVEFDSPAQISYIWNAKITSHVGTHYVISSVFYNSKVAAGKSASFGYAATPGAVASTPTNLTINGVAVGTPSTTPSVSIANATVAEGNSGTSNLAFNVTLSKAATSPVTVGYATANGTATAGSDYTATSGTITFAAGETSKTVNVAVTGDTTVESNETLTVALSSPSGATIATGSATGTITNDDVAQTPPTVSIANASKSEGNSGTSNLAFTVTLSKTSTSPVTVQYATSNGTATAGSDYTATSGTITFAAGETSKTVNVAVTGDTTVESNETLTVTLSSPSGATIATGSATGTITNDDVAQTPPTVSIANASKSEGNSGTSNLAFTVTLSKTSTSPVTVQYATSNGTATAGSDYTATSGTITFAAGETSKTVNVAVTGDTTVESNETLTVTLSSPSGATIATGSATGTITNDDAAAQPGGPAVPFGSHTRPYAAGTILPTASQATMDAATVALYNTWKSNFLVSAGNYGLAVKSDDADYPYVAEAQGYGMELTVLMAGADPTAQTSFDGILKYVLAHPSANNSALLAAEQNASFVSVNGSDSATDGDLAVAYALLLADKQWGSTGTYNYKQLAITRINAIKASEMDPNTKLPTLGDWNTPGDSLYNSTRPSDFMIDHFRAFAVATGDPFWDSAVTASQNLITAQQTTYSPNTGLIADFVVNTNSTPKPAPANFLEGKTDGQYSYNAVRVPWHIGADAAVYGDATSKAQAQKITAWFRTKTGDDPTKVVSGYKLDGTATVTYLDPEFVATLGPAAMGNAANQAWLDKIWAYTVAQSKTSAMNDYYAASLVLESMIVMSGNYWAP